MLAVSTPSAAAGTMNHTGLTIGGGTGTPLTECVEVNGTISGLVKQEPPTMQPPMGIFKFLGVCA